MQLVGIYDGKNVDVVFLWWWWWGPNETKNHIKPKKSCNPKRLSKIEY